MSITVNNVSSESSLCIKLDGQMYYFLSSKAWKICCLRPAIVTQQIKVREKLAGRDQTRQSEIPSRDL